MSLVTTMTKIVILIWNASDERLGLLYEDMRVRNTTSASNGLCKIMCITINSRVLRIDYIASYPIVAKFGKQIDTIKFISNLFRDLPTLQNLNVMKAEDQCVQPWNTQFSIMKYDTSNMWLILHQYLVRISFKSSLR